MGNRSEGRARLRGLHLVIMIVHRDFVADQIVAFFVFWIGLKLVFATQSVDNGCYGVFSTCQACGIANAKIEGVKIRRIFVYESICGQDRILL